MLGLLLNILIYYHFFYKFFNKDYIKKWIINTLGKNYRENSILKKKKWKILKNKMGGGNKTPPINKMHIIYYWD